MGKILREGSENLTGGEVNSLPGHLIGLGEAKLAENTDPRSLVGVSTRNGRSVYGSNYASDLAIDGLKCWTRNAGTAFIIVRSSGSFLSWTPAPIASIASGGTAGSIFQGAALANVLAIVVDGMTPQRYDPTLGTVVALGAAAPAEAKYCVEHISKIFLAGNDAAPQTVYWSKTDDPTEFSVVVAPNDAGSADMFYGGGDSIKGLVSNGRNLLILFRNSTYILSGDAPSNMRIDKLCNYGLVSPTGHARAGEVAFFASDDAVYMVAGNRISDLTTLKFKSVYQAIADKSKITLGVTKDLLMVVDYGADKAYVCAYKYNRWAEWTGQIWKCIDTDLTQTIYAGVDGASTTQLWNLDTGSLDGASTITAKWKTPDLDWGWSDCPKNLANVRIHGNGSIGTVTITYFKDGASIGSINQTASMASDGSHTMGGFHSQSQVRGRFLGFQFSWVGPGTLLGWAAYSEVTVDAGSIPPEY